MTAGRLEAPPRLAFAGRERQFRDHLVPIWKAIPDEWRGPWLGDELAKTPLRGPIVVASWGDYKRIRSGPRVYMEHGTGMWHGTRHPSYSGGRGKDDVSLFLVPNHFTAERNRERYPSIPNVVVGIPKLDEWANYRHVPDPDGPVVCFSFHWDGGLEPEMKWALPHYRAAIRRFVKTWPGKVIGHGHPRNWVVDKGVPFWYALWRGLGVEPVWDFNEVLRRADIYVNDFSSTAWEFAATGRPVLSLNAPWYRRDRDDGHPRFWRYVPGLQIDDPADLIDGVERALAGEGDDLARSAVDAVIPHLGEATPRAVAALSDWWATL